ncbi:hypothetical protein [Polaromonas sp. CG_23.6]|uniref:hypothetical protein n=1 Tax=Polaromonas sp. CG_23.6 TaxID=2760709 RepID=UPI0032B001B1
MFHGLVPKTRVGTTFGHEFTRVIEEVGASRENSRSATRCRCRSMHFAATAIFVSASFTATATTSTPKFVKHFAPSLSGLAACCGAALVRA